MAARQGIIVTVSGKGGTGKTTFTALMLKLLLKIDGKKILVVDADPATNLPDVLNAPVAVTVGMVATELKKKIAGDEIPSDMDKKSLLEGLIMQVLVEKPQFDLLAMGRTEGEGCYCLLNNLLTDIIDTLSKNYDLVLIDMEAGLEHLSRRTARDVDVMFILTDPSKMGFQTAKRIRNLSNEVHIKFQKRYLVGSTFPENAVEMLKEEAESLGVELAGIIPVDTKVILYNVAGNSLLDLPNDSPAVIAVKNILDKSKIFSINAFQ